MDPHILASNCTVYRSDASPTHPIFWKTHHHEKLSLAKGVQQEMNSDLEKGACASLGAVFAHGLESLGYKSLGLRTLGKPLNPKP